VTARRSTAGDPREPTEPLPGPVGLLRCPTDPVDVSFISSTWAKPQRNVVGT
jgi:hypothetical protein